MGYYRSITVALMFLLAISIVSAQLTPDVFHNAENVKPGTFGSIVGANANSNWTFDGNLGIGSSSPGAKLDVEITSGGAATIGESTNTAFGIFAVAMGSNADASGSQSTAMGDGTTASGISSTAMGDGTTASNTASTAMGDGTLASGVASTAMGENTIASGSPSTAMGKGTTASGSGSTALGNSITVSGTDSFGIGLDGSSNTLSQSNTMSIMGGNVGIGTITPSAALEVVGSIETTSLNDNTGSNFFSTNCIAGTAVAGISDTGSLNCVSLTVVPGGNEGDGDWIIEPDNDMFNNGFASVGIGTSPSEKLHVVGNIFSDGGTVKADAFSSNSPLDLELQTAGTTRIFADSGTGDVGIGTASPGAKLEVAGQVKITGGAPGVGKVLTSDAAGLATWAVAAGGANGWVDDGANVRLDTIGDSVGIGTATPSTKLEVVGSVKATAFTSASPLLLQTAGTTRIFASDSTGRVGINTLTPGDYRLNIQGTGEDGGLLVQSDGSGTAFRVNDGPGDTTPLVVNADGDVGIGTTTPSAKLDVEVVSGGAATLGSSSNTAAGTNAVAMGTGNTASGSHSVAMGFGTTAGPGSGATAMGDSTIALSQASTAMGSGTVASNFQATAMGLDTTASGQSSLSTGRDTTAAGASSTAMGEAITVSASGANSFGIGLDTTPTIITDANTMAIMGGEVGIGTVSPDEELHIVGSVKIVDGTQAAGRVLTSDATGKATWAPAGGGGANGWVDDGVNVRLDTISDKVGIGTTTPSAKLDVEVSSGGAATIGSSTNTAAGNFAVAMGEGNTASGPRSLAVGQSNTASGNRAVAMGESNVASSDGSVALGTGNTASGSRSIALGSSTTAGPGGSALSSGFGTTASGAQSTAMGFLTTASGSESTAMGRKITVSGINSFGIGLDSSSNTLSQNNAMAIMGGNVGIGTVAPSEELHVVGSVKIVDGSQGSGKVLTSDAAGVGTWTTPAGGGGSGWTDDGVNVRLDTISDKVGIGTTSPSAKLDVEVSSGGAATIGSSSNVVSGDFGVAMGSGTTAGGGSAATAMGGGTTASGGFSTAMGSGSTASGQISTAMGEGTTANAASSTAMGSGTLASGVKSTAMGAATTASGPGSTAMGTSTTASGLVSIAMGEKITVSGTNSVGIGLDTNPSTVSQSNTMAIMGGKVGIGTVAPSEELHVVGSVRIVDGTQAAGRVLTSDATGKATWAPAGGGGANGWVDDGVNVRLDTISDSVGIGTTTPSAKLDVEVSSGGAATIGHVDNVASGNFAVAMGRDTTASNDQSTAMGRGTLASGVNSVAMGFDTVASGARAVSMGDNSEASATSSTAMGSGTTASGVASTAMGLSTEATGPTTTAMGQAIIVSGTNSVGIGLDTNPSTVSQNNAMAIMGGNVGIGTVAPSEELHVVGSVKIVDGNQGSGKVLTSDANGVGTWSAAGGANTNAETICATNLFLDGDGDCRSTSQIVADGGGSDTNAKTLCPDGEFLQGDGSTICKTATEIFAANTGTLPVNRGGTGATVASTARTNLAAAGTGACGGGQFVTSTTGSGVNCATPAGGTGGWDDSASNIVKLDTIGDKVGIGTASPTLGKLEVQGGSTRAIYAESTGAGSGIWGKSNSGRGVEGSSSSGVGGYFASSSGFGLIVETGNVGIGFTNPTAKLQVQQSSNNNGISSSTSGSANAISGQATSTTGTAVFGHQTHQASSTGFAASFVSVGTNKVLKLQDSSGICFAVPTTGGLTWSCSSDERLKTNITDASPVMDYLEQFRMRDFIEKETGEEMTGVIAQEVKEIYPDLVTEGDDGYLMVSAPSQWVLVKALQEQQEIIDSQQDQIDKMFSILCSQNPNIDGC